MPSEPSRKPSLAWVRLAGWLALPTLGIVVKYGGICGLAVYLTALPLTLLIYARFASAVAVSRVSESRGFLLALLAFLVLTVTFAVVYPIADAGRVVGGSDSDDALDLAVSELVHGRYPYRPHTYLDNPISPLPGAVLLAIPFVLAGGSALQSLFWLAALFAVARHILGGSSLALGLLTTILLASPAVLAQILTGTDYVANAAYVLVFAVLASGSGRRATRFAGAVLLGIGLSSRANYFFVEPFVISTLAVRFGGRAALSSAATTAAVFCAVTLPFYLYSPDEFTPLHTYEKLAQFDSLVPHVDLIIIMSMAVASMVLTVRSRRSGAILPFESIAAVQAIPVLCTAVLGVVRDGSGGLALSGYGTSVVFFGCLDAMEAILHDRHAKQNRSL